MTDSELRRLVDARHPAHQSLPLRYHATPYLSLDEAALGRASIAEGARILPLLEHRGVPVYILDETSRMETGTFEALVAAVALAHCAREGLPKLIFSSGGNLGLALSAYARRVGIESWSLCPMSSVPWLDERIYNGDGQHLVGIADAQKTREMVLGLRKRLLPRLDYDPLVPRMDWRMEALRCRGLFVAEYSLETGVEFAAIAQTISAGFGPLAIFDVLGDLVDEGALRGLPRFFGIQQRANCGMAQRWRGEKIAAESELIVPTLFDHDPDKSFGTYERLAALLERTRGDLVTVDWDEFDRHLESEVLAALQECGVHHAVGEDGFLARSGLMALAGVLKSIEAGALEEGPVLVCMCDGSRKPSSPASVDFRIESPEDLDDLAERFLEGA